MWLKLGSKRLEMLTDDENRGIDDENTEMNTETVGQLDT
jgi:hypothetical protein